MAVYKEEKTNTWRVIYRYTDWTGERKQSQRRGFKTKREALAWEREQLNKSTADLDMTFASFVEQYTADMKTHIKENTWATKDHIIRTKLLPFFGKLKMCNITAQQIITWQNEMLDHKDENGKKYTPVYLRSVNSQLSAIFNHAVRYYNLRENPCKKAGSMGKKKNREMLFWTKEEYLKFAEVMINSLSVNGRIAAVAPHGVLFRGAAEGRIRQKVVDENLLDGVIGLPENLFYGTSIPACILVFKKNRSNTDVLFIDASKKDEDGNPRYIKASNQNELGQRHIDAIVQAYQDRTEQEKFAHVATLNEIKENEYNLNIPRYVDTFEEEAPIDLQQVQSNIARLKVEIADAEKKMDAYLKELGL